MKNLTLKDWLQVFAFYFVFMGSQAWLNRLEVEEVRKAEYSRGFDDGWESNPTECTSADAIKWWTGETDLKAARAKICGNYNRGK